MKAVLGVIIVFAAGACHAAQTYKWVDEKGVTNYGEKPPEASRAVPVDTEPQGVVGTGGEAARRVEADRRERAEGRPVPIQVVPVPVPSSYARAAPVRGMTFDTFIRLERGMTEGELLIRAGAPDHQSLDGYQDYVVKTFYYFPTLIDPFTTVVRLRGGRIASLERIRRF
jgi:hypothetical protein